MRDDALFFAASLEVLELALKGLHEDANPLGLLVSWIKIKVQVLEDLLNGTIESVHVCDEDIEIFDNLTYLSRAVHSSGRSSL